MSGHDPTAEMFTSEDVCQIAGVSYRSLDYWCRVGIFDVPGRGSGTQRAWRPEDLAIVIVLAALRPLSRDLRVLGRVAEYLTIAGYPVTGLLYVPTDSEPVIVDLRGADPAGTVELAVGALGPGWLIDLDRVLSALPAAAVAA